MAELRMTLRCGGRFHDPAMTAAGAGVQAASGPQMVMRAGALRVVMPRPAAGNACPALVLWSRCRSRPVVIRRLPSSCRTASRLARRAAAGRLAVAVPSRAAVMAARRAAVNEISRGWTGCPARRPFLAGAA
jgi:hypothetical protein